MQDGRQNAVEILSGGKAYKDISEMDSTYVTNEMFNKWVEKYGLQKAVGLNDTTKKELLRKLREVLSEGIEEGDTLEDIMEKLQKASNSVFDEMSKSRAFLIARTETASSVNLGQTATYKAYGVQEKEWLATIDNRTRDSHLWMHEQRVPIDVEFEVPNSEGGSDRMQYPADPNGSAGNVCNCRCTVSPVIEL